MASGPDLHDDPHELFDVGNTGEGAAGEPSMPIAIARTPSTVTVHARCDACRTIASEDGVTAGAAIDKLEAVGWKITIETSAARCTRCSDDAEFL